MSGAAKMKRRRAPGGGRKGLDGVVGSGESPALRIRVKREQLAQLDSIVEELDGVNNRSEAIRWLITDHIRWRRLEEDSP
jgi:hypothetical protein